MKTMIKSFADISADDQRLAGGKGGTLARLSQAGYPVPDGFVVFPQAFENDQIKKEAWGQILEKLEQLRKQDRDISFAVRSSALAEDSAFASFAGEFETILDVRTDEAVRAAIYQVYHSKESERVKAYIEAKGLEEEQDIAIVIQRLIRADISGILFTADPVTGNRANMPGNYVHGFGEELVSGEAEPFVFNLSRPKGSYEGNEDLERHARKLFDLATKLEKNLNSPQDIEWAIADGDLFLLQSRPITTLSEYDILTGEYNSSFSGDYVWIGHDVYSDIMTPSTFSIFNHLHNFEIEGMRVIGNIGGRLYMNFSLVYLMMQSFGQNSETIQSYTKLTTGFDLSKITFPEMPISRWKVIKNLLPLQLRLFPIQAKLMKKLEEIIGVNADCCEKLIIQIKYLNKQELVNIWHDEVFPLLYRLLMVQDKANEGYFYPYLSARKILVKLMGESEADACLSGLVGSSGHLASLAPIINIAKVASGEMSRREYTSLAGHRFPKEDEISIARPYEDSNWLEKRLEEYHESPLDYETILQEQSEKTEQNWKSFESTYSKTAKTIKKKLEKISLAMEKREIIRSELTRSLSVIREWYLRAGSLTSLGEDVFFLEDHEVLGVLLGKTEVVSYLPFRRKTFEKQVALPKYPPLISGRFDPYSWAADPNRRSDIYDSHVPLLAIENADKLSGQPGSAGRAEGLVRIIHNPEDSDQFQSGEILVASSTNVGWTPLFPRAAAVITDVGAPLSHAAIVARELGIPAVVGTGNATMALKTGDRVLVDGSQGVIKIIKSSRTP